MKTILVRVLLFVILPLIAMTAYLISAYDLGMPQLDGQVSVKGVNDQVSVSRDQNGVVIIESSNDEDVFFGMGYAHAQDRLWQLVMQKRLAQGRLSEIFGESTVNSDAQMRTLDLYQAAKSSWQALSVDAKASLTAYSQGINAWLEQVDSLPPEFIILGVEPEPWTEIDSLAWAKVFAMNLSNSMWEELTYYFAKQYLTPEQADELLAGPSQKQHVTAVDVDDAVNSTMASIMGLQHQFRQELNVGGKFVGSNAWAISGRLTDDGNAILANDPHLSIQMPSLWYIAKLKGQKLDASGMSLIGLPLIIFGRNQHIAWGGTSMTADVQDLYFEQVNGNDATQYFDQGEWKNFAMRSHFINVRPQFPAQLREKTKPLEIKVRSTVRGPVVSDVFGLTNHPVSLRWPGLDDGDTTYESFFRLNYATDYAGFKSALSFYRTPTMNFLYSDSKGNIGYLGAGSIPIRKTGQGQSPIQGGTNEHRWLGYIPFEQWPQMYNPPEGYIVSANDFGIIGDDYPHFISYVWAPSDRANRIKQLLRERINNRQKLTLEDMEAIQSDTVSFGGKALIKVLAAAEMDTEQQKQAQNLVANWNGDMAADSASAAIFNNWVRHLRLRLYKSQLKAPYNLSYQNGILSDFYQHVAYQKIVEALTPDGPSWCVAEADSEQAKCNIVIQQALDGALKDLTKLMGSDMDDWSWGEVHHSVYQHTPFSQTNMLKGIFERRVTNGGAANTINVAASSFDITEGFEQYFGAGFRQIIRLGQDKVDHLYMNSTGQSGNVLSEHYDDMIKPFRDVEFVSDADAVIKHKIVLKSAGAQ